jgi:hypothetical protein
MMVSFGQLSIANMEWEWTTVDGGRPSSGKGLMRVQQLYQTAAFRFAPYNKPTMRIMLEASFRNNSLGKKIKDGAEDERLLKELFFPYFETSELEGMVRLDVSIVRFFAGARYFLPPEGNDAQVRPEAGLYLMFR